MPNKSTLERRAESATAEVIRRQREQQAGALELRPIHASLTPDEWSAVRWAASRRPLGRHRNASPADFFRLGVLGEVRRVARLQLASGGDIPPGIAHVITQEGVEV